jgi:serine protease Do
MTGAAMPRPAVSPPSLRRWWAEGVALLAALILVLAVPPARAEGAWAAMAQVFTVHAAEGEGRFLGSAFRWETGDLAVTNAHVVGRAAEVILTDAAGGQVRAPVLAVDPVRDVAILALAPGPAGLAARRAPADPGLEVYALGAPLGIGFTMSGGMISARARQVEPAVPLRLIQHDAAVNPGSSGGPLVDAAGRLVGMNARIADGSRLFVGIAWAIGAEDLSRIVADLRAGPGRAMPDLGLRGREVTAQVARALGLAPGGILVEDVAPGGLAARAGLRAGDVIRAAGGKGLARPGDLAFAMEAALEAGEVDLALWRAGQAALVTLDLAAQAPAPRAPAPAAPPATLAELGVVPDAAGRIAAVAEGTAAARAGLAPGDRLVAVNGAPPDPARLHAGPVLLLVEGERGATRHLILDPAETDPVLRPLGAANVLDPRVIVF